ncbi:MAG: hypothetical protein GXP60_02410 [Epsilonproteobacteria bacterium]|nr:hypothetical protein [Campylobacterota bacterium]
MTLSIDIIIYSIEKDYKIIWLGYSFKNEIEVGESYFELKRVKNKGEEVQKLFLIHRKPTSEYY